MVVRNRCGRLLRKVYGYCCEYFLLVIDGEEVAAALSFC